MKRIAHSLTLSLLIPFLSGCRVETVRHEPTIAASNTNSFLKALYVDENYPRALELADVQLRQSTNADNLRQMVEGIKLRRGRLKTLKVDSYLMVQGRGMELFYVATYEEGTLYHRLVVIGDAESGYRVSGVWYQLDPYPDQPLRRKFSQEIWVK